MNKILALIASLIEDFIFIIVLLIILPLFGIYLPSWFIALILAILIIISAITYRALSVLKKPAILGKEVLIGKTGEAISDFNHEGLVYLENEVWTAISRNGKIKKGDKVIVRNIQGTKLIVEKI